MFNRRGVTLGVELGFHLRYGSNIFLTLWNGIYNLNSNIYNRLTVALFIAYSTLLFYVTIHYCFFCCYHLIIISLSSHYLIISLSLILNSSTSVTNLLVHQIVDSNLLCFLNYYSNHSHYNLFITIIHYYYFL